MFNKSFPACRDYLPGSFQCYAKAISICPILQILLKSQCKHNVRTLIDEIVIGLRLVAL